MSTLEVNTINPQSGTTITIGGSGDTVSLGSGATQSGFGGVNTPSFFAYLSSDQTLTDDTSVKIQFDTEIFDSDGTYDNSTNYRFTPAVAGKYYVFAGLRYDNIINQATIRNQIYVNGSVVNGSFLAGNNSSSNRDYTIETSAILNLDSDDYVEIYGNSNNGTVVVNGDTTYKSYFGAYKLIGA